MKVAVTGASGFVGRHVVNALRSHGAEVIAISRHPDPVSDTAITPLALDISDPANGNMECLGRPDILVHLAWGALNDYQSRQHLSHELPTHYRFLKTCIESGLDRLLVTGTCLEYGLQEGELAETSLGMPVTSYAQAKDNLRQELFALAKIHNFELGWLRPFYLFGSGQPPGSLYPQLRAAITSKENRFSMSSGDQVRDFLAIEMAASHIAKLALFADGIGIVNICSGSPVRVIDKVNEWLQEWSAQIVLERGLRQMPEYEPFAFWGSTQRLNYLLQSAPESQSEYP